MGFSVDDAADSLKVPMLGYADDAADDGLDDAAAYDLLVPLDYASDFS